jgi:hypothetical protein
MPQKNSRSVRIALAVAPSVVFASTSERTAKQTENEGDMETDIPYVIGWQLIPVCSISRTTSFRLSQRNISRWFYLSDDLL